MFFFASCTKKTPIFIDKTYTLCPRKCNYAYVTNADLRKDNILWYTFLGPDGEVPINSYAIALVTTNKSAAEWYKWYTPKVEFKFYRKPPKATEEIEQEAQSYERSVLAGELDILSSPPYKDSHDFLKAKETDWDEPDPSIERLIEKYFSQWGLKSEPRAILEPELKSYRTSFIRDVYCTSSTEFLGRAAGEKLNDFFETLGFKPGNFIITEARNLLSEDQEIFVDLNKFSSYQPLAPSAMVLGFRKGLKLTAPLSTSFTITIVTDEGKTIRATTPKVRLLP